ncbi:MAG: murein hydrolase activator EnvC family protein, partial [Nannocystaceae bacterium]
VGSLTRPVGGRIVGSYGQSKDPLLDLPIYRDGVEIRAKGRQPSAVAAATGTVVAVGELSGYEEVVVLQHDGGFLSLTGHLRGVVVERGQRVRRGDVLGRVASKQVKDGLGRTVYFELRHGERPIDPSRFLRKF